MTPFSLLIKPVSADCNLECQYCFYKKTKKLYSVNTTVMTIATLETIVQKYLGMNFNISSLCFQGGEPLLLDPHIYYRIPDIFNKYANSEQILEISFQTNAVLITREWTKLFSLLHALVGVSLDGPQNIHDTYRYDSNGSGTFNSVMKGIDFLISGNIPFNLLSMITHKSCRNADSIYSFFLKEHFKWIQFIPCIEIDPVTRKLTPYSITSEEYGSFYSSLFDRWFENGYPDISIRLFEDILFFLVDGINISCTCKSLCDSHLIIEYNGDVYPCDFFVNNEWRIGNIQQHSLSELISHPLRIKFMNLKSEYAVHCTECKFYTLCHGGCMKHYLYFNLNNKIPNHLCNGFQMFLNYSYDRFLEIRNDIIKRRNEK